MQQLTQSLFIIFCFFCVSIIFCQNSVIQKTSREAELIFKSDSKNSSPKKEIKKSYKTRNSLQTQIPSLIGKIFTFAGTKDRDVGDGLDGSNSFLYQPVDIQMDLDENLFISDRFNQRIRFWNKTSNKISTLVGTGETNFTPPGLFGNETNLNFPFGLAFSSSKNLLYYAESISGYVRTLNITSQRVQEITNVTFSIPFGLAISEKKNGLFITEYGASKISFLNFTDSLVYLFAGSSIGISGFSGDGGDSLLALLNYPTFLFLDKNETFLYFSDCFNNRIRRIELDNNRTITTIAGNGVSVYLGQNLPTLNSSVYNPFGVKMNSKNQLHFSTSNSIIRRIVNENQTIINVAGIPGSSGFNGDNIPSLNAQISIATSILFDSLDNLIFTDRNNNRIRKIEKQTQTISTIIGNGKPFNLGTDLVLTKAQFNRPTFMIENSIGDIYFSDSGIGLIRKIDRKTGILGIICGNGIPGNSIDGNGLSTSLNFPNGLFLDEGNNLLYFSERRAFKIKVLNLTSNSLITFAGTGNSNFSSNSAPLETNFNSPCCVYFSKKNNLFYIADIFRIRTISINSNLRNVSSFIGTGLKGSGGDGSLAINATFNGIQSFIFDEIENRIFICDSGNDKIRIVNTTTGIIQTLLGTGLTNFSGDSGFGPNFNLNQPFSLAFNQIQNLLFIGESDNSRVLQLNLTSNFVEKISGSSNQFGSPNEGDFANQSLLLYPQNLLLLKSGNLLISDLSNKIWVIYFNNNNESIFNRTNLATTDFVFSGTIATSSNNSDNLNNNNNSNITIVAIVVPILFLLIIFVIVVILVFVYLRKKKRNELINDQLQFQLQNIEKNKENNNQNENSVKFLTDIEICEKIGSGQFGSVFKGKWNKSIFVAMKTLTNQEAMKDFLDEMKILEKIKHPNVIQYFGIFKDSLEEKEFSFIVTEFMNKGSLLNLLQEKNTKFSSFQLLDFCKQACNGMIYLSNENIIHRDLALRNLLVHQENENSNFIIKICDFGLSRVALNHYYITSSNMLPIKWCSPEVLEKRKFSIQSDIWSFGIVLWEIFSIGKTPYPDLDINQTAKKVILEGYRMENPNENLCSKEIYSLMLDCWKFETNERPSFNQIYERLN